MSIEHGLSYEVFRTRGFCNGYLVFFPLFSSCLDSIVMKVVNT
jgi:hypothetical protein